MAITFLKEGTVLGTINLTGDVIFAKDGPKSIQTKIIRRSKIIVDKALIKAKPQIEMAARIAIGQAIRAEKEYKSLIGSQHGDLRAVMGLDNAVQRVNAIIETWLDSTKVTLKKTKTSNGDMEASLRLTMGLADYSDVFSKAEATIQTKKRQSLEWLKALLTWGDKIIVYDYVVFEGNFRASRSGRAIMSKRLGSRWNVPSTYRGTVNDNWLTHALDGIQPKIEAIILKAFTKGQ